MLLEATYLYLKQSHFLKSTKESKNLNLYFALEPLTLAAQRYSNQSQRQIRIDYNKSNPESEFLQVSCSRKYDQVSIVPK